ncbi:MAG TPA: hypothetical protein VF756_23050, partial [Thermoanaerobaculia bacterium]
PAPSPGRSGASHLVSARRLEILAWANVGLHALGLVVAWIGMRPGSVVMPVTERTAYLAGNPPAWAWGWGIWMACTLLLVAYLAALRRLIPDRPVTADLAVLFAVAGMAADLLCDVVQIRVLPLVAAVGPEHRTLFLAVERLAFTGGATVANGLYTAAVLLMTLSLRGHVRSLTRLAGWATAVAGSAMVVSGLLPSPELLQASTGPTIGFFSLWTVLVARDLRPLTPWPALPSPPVPPGEGEKE